MAGGDLHGRFPGPFRLDTGLVLDRKGETCLWRAFLFPSRLSAGCPLLAFLDGFPSGCVWHGTGVPLEGCRNELRFPGMAGQDSRYRTLVVRYDGRHLLCRLYGGEPFVRCEVGEEGVPLGAGGRMRRPVRCSVPVWVSCLYGPHPLLLQPVPTASWGGFSVMAVQWSCGVFPSCWR